MCRTCCERGHHHKTLEGCVSSLLTRLHDSETERRSLALRLERVNGQKRKLATLIGEEHVEERVAVLEAKVAALEDR